MTGQDIKIGHKMRYALYAIVCVDYFCNGLSLSLLGPAVKDLSLLLDTSQERILFGFTVKSFANGAASLLGTNLCASDSPISTS